MLDLINMAAEQVAAFAPGAVIDPGAGEAPPGAEKIITIVRWAAWLAAGACVLAALAVGALMAMRRDNHGGGRSATDLGWVLAGAIVVGAASSIVGALI